LWSNECIGGSAASYRLSPSRPRGTYLGLFAATRGHLDGAVRHFEAAMRLNARMGAACYLPNSRYQYARVLRARGAACDHELADDHMGRAIASATALGPSFSCGVPTSQERPRSRSPSMAPSARKAEPQREFHALDLAVWTSGGAAGSAPSPEEGEELLDQQARAAYQQRIAELTEELEEAQGWGDTSVPPARREIDAITEQLAAAVGLGGRDRRAASEAERARVSVTKALKSAIRRIARRTPSSGSTRPTASRQGTSSPTTLTRPSPSPGPSDLRRRSPVQIRPARPDRDRS
jgi:hypothetical protein